MYTSYINPGNNINSYTSNCYSECLPKTETIVYYKIIIIKENEDNARNFNLNRNTYVNNSYNIGNTQYYDYQKPSYINYKINEENNNIEMRNRENYNKKIYKKNN